MFHSVVAEEDQENQDNQSKYKHRELFLSQSNSSRQNSAPTTLHLMAMSFRREIISGSRFAYGHYPGVIVIASIASRVVVI